MSEHDRLSVGSVQSAFDTHFPIDGGLTGDWEATKETFANPGPVGASDTGFGRPQAVKRDTLYRDCFQHLYSIERKRIAPTPVGHLRLHRGERVEPWSIELLDQIAQAVRWDRMQQYSDYEPFYDKLSRWVNVPKENIVVGAGIEDLIRSLTMLTCDPGDKIAYTWPTCAMFDVYARVFGAEPVRIVTDPDEPLRVSEVCKHIVPGVRLFILPNPGQPVDVCFSINEIHSIAQHCEEVGAILALDEAYWGFGAPTGVALIEEHKNLVVLRTFSKAFGAASIRVGFAMGSHNVIKPLEAVRQSGEISGPSLRAATVLIDNWLSHVKPGVREVCAGRDWLRDTVNSMSRPGVKARGSYANHVLIDVGDQGKMESTLYNLRVWETHVKGGFGAPLDRHLLVTCGSIPVMAEFFKKLRGAI